MPLSRRSFIKSGFAAAALPLLPVRVHANPTSNKSTIRPQALKKGDTIGLITPASPLFEAHRTVMEAEVNLEQLGFKTKTAKNIFKKRGYLAGTIAERVADLHDMFKDPDVNAIMTIRGGYGSAQLLPYLDYKLIQNHPKILIGYSDVTSLLNGIHKKTGLVTFHGPVAVSTFTDYTKEYFYKVLENKKAVGLIDAESFGSESSSINHVWTFRKGIGEGLLVGGNITLMQSLVGTPYDFNGDGAILFFEEVGEEPYDLDRILTQMKQAGKFNKCRGVFFDRLDSTRPSSYKPAFKSSLSVEEVIEDIFKDFDFPVCVGFSIGHIKDKPTLPIGVRARLDADNAQIHLLEAAVS